MTVSFPRRAAACALSPSRFPPLRSHAQTLPTGRIVGRVIDARPDRGFRTRVCRSSAQRSACSPASTDASPYRQCLPAPSRSQVRRVGLRREDRHRSRCSTAGQTLEQNVSLVDRGSAHRRASRHGVGGTRHRQRSARPAAHRGRRRELDHRRADRQEPGRRRRAGGASA